MYVINKKELGLHELRLPGILSSKPQNIPPTYYSHNNNPFLGPNPVIGQLKGLGKENELNRRFK